MKQGENDGKRIGDQLDLRAFFCYNTDMMDIENLLTDKAKKPTEKRAEIAETLKNGTLTIDDITSVIFSAPEKSAALILEVLEAISNKTSQASDLKWLKLAEDFLTSSNNNAKREASRVIGNIAHLYPNDLSGIVQKLIANTKCGGTVIRWGSAYALARIIVIPAYANGELYGTLTDMAEKEDDSGVKNQYLGGLKKAKKLRTL